MNLIFPVAGEGSRFGDVFKPFLKIGDKHFIEVTYEPFKKWEHEISSVVFICTEEQDRKFAVEETLKKIIEHPRVQVIKLENKTSGRMRLSPVPSHSYWMVPVLYVIATTV